ncbi:MAG: signal peptidase II [Clostridiales bacterium]|nr:signal peptidase II [Clostridiales bacterium]HBM81782.1 signal peptidase II [Clostridiaceae bacterium]
MLQLMIIFSIVFLDRITKRLAVVYLKPVGSIPLIKNIFHLTYAENKGAAFSILQNQRWFFISVTIVFIFFAMYYLFLHKNENIILKIGLSMVIGGAIGNLIDRIIPGYVVDFFDFRAVNFAIFNVADCGIVIGSILLGYYLIFISEKDASKVLRK